MKRAIISIFLVVGVGLVVGGCEGPGPGRAGQAGMLKIDAVCDVAAGARAPVPSMPGEPVHLCTVGTFNLGDFPN
jgi:hypothetical protein